MFESIVKETKAALKVIVVVIVSKRIFPNCHAKNEVAT